MSSTDDVTDAMLPGLSLGVGTADALFEGRVEPEDAPPGLREVAALVLAARSLDANGGLAGEDSVVAAFVESVRATPPSIVDATEGGGHMFSRHFSAKVAGVAAVLAFGGATAAAATGSLPGSVQAAVSHNLSHLGISVPDPATGTGTSDGAGSSAGHGRTATATALPTTASEYGLCTAYSAPDSRASGTTARGSALSSVAFSRLSAAATAKGETVQAFCAAVPKPGTTSGSDSTSDSASTTDTGKPAANPAGKTPGPPATTPAGNTPGQPPATNPAGKTPGPPATNSAGDTSGGPASTTPPGNSGNAQTTPNGNDSTPGTTPTSHGQSGASAHTNH